ncbi:DUF11 domain-containing protein [Modestobacter sp. L9-4]|uniref:DUF11 domain-containing protein n=1 Tax=Modestobacter sp. L9-4 TaxID=2851567 RepID=UPI001C7875B9|nr:DUF11 domain-containing protein [Modestobacter sp. L9-4]QXG75642.1 DUF11 domain-containing protein [Modestobacter sp. L9-4]
MVTIVPRRPVRTWWPALLACALVVTVGGVVATAPTADAVQTPTECANAVGLVNGGFELPAVKVNELSFFDQSKVPGWKTTASDGQIEIWHNVHEGVTAAGGTQHAELNANKPSALYQDLPTIPGTVMRWSLAHRGRTGADTMAVSIGPAGDTLVEQRQITDDTSAWGRYSGLYTVPAGQTTTRFSFGAVSTNGGKLSIGNFLDDITFGTNGCLVSTQDVTSSSGGPYAQAGDVLTITVRATSGGGNPALGTSLSSPLPAGTSLVPGSIRVTGPAGAATVSDGKGDDLGEYDPVTRQVVVRLGTGATSTTGGSLAEGEVGTVTYQVRVDPSTQPSTSTSESVVTYTDPLANTVKTSTTNTASMVLSPVADVAVTVARTSTGAVVAGLPVTYTATLTNLGGTSSISGQDYAYATRLTSQLPAALTAVTGSTPGGTCTVSGSTLTCDVGTLTRNATATVTVTATVLSDTPPAVRGLAFTVTGTTGSRDLTPGNDSATATDDLTAVADVGVTLSTSSAPPVAGTDVTYTAVLTNRGPSTARSVVLSDVLPTGTSNPRGSVPGGTCTVPPGSPASLQCTVPAVQAGASTTVTVVLFTDPSLTGTLSNTVSVTATTPDPAAADNTATVSRTMTAVADVRAVLTVPPGNVPLGGSTAYTLTITNAGPSTAVNVGISGGAPAGFTVNPPSSPYCSYSGCTIPSLRPGASAVIKGTAPVAKSTAPGRAPVYASAYASTFDPNTADNTSNTIVLVGAPSLQVSVLGAITDTRRTRGAATGDDVVWTYVVSNTGDVDVTGLSVLLANGNAVPSTCQAGTLPKGATAACRAALPQRVTAADVSGLAVKTTAQVTGSWVGGTEVRSPSVGGSVVTVLPSAGALQASGVSTTSTLQPSPSSITSVLAPAPVLGLPAPWLRTASASSVVGVPASTGR